MKWEPVVVDAEAAIHGGSRKARFAALWRNDLRRRGAQQEFERWGDVTSTAIRRCWGDATVTWCSQYLAWKRI